MATVHHHMHHGLPAGGMMMGAAQALGNHQGMNSMPMGQMGGCMNGGFNPMMNGPMRPPMGGAQMMGPHAPGMSPMMRGQAQGLPLMGM